MLMILVEWVSLLNSKTIVNYIVIIALLSFKTRIFNCINSERFTRKLSKPGMPTIIIALIISGFFFFKLLRVTCIDVIII